jgi:hypothetical protein
MKLRASSMEAFAAVGGLSLLLAAVMHACSTVSQFQVAVTVAAAVQKWKPPDTACVTNLISGCGLMESLLLVDMCTHSAQMYVKTSPTLSMLFRGLAA